jgi:hypothetical protein
MACWEQRGCDEEMQAECPHSAVIEDNCPNKCAFAMCDRPTYRVTIDPAMIFSTDADRAAAIKDCCLTCQFFFEHGPKVGDTA